MTEFFKAQPSDMTDLVALHRFRIRGKKLRYAMELLASAFAPEFREELYPTVERVQEHLGEINDHAVAWSRLAIWLSRARGKRADYVHQLLCEEYAELDKSRGAFREWWKEETQQQLRQRFGEFLSAETSIGIPGGDCLQPQETRSLARIDGTP